MGESERWICCWDGSGHHIAWVLTNGRCIRTLPAITRYGTTRRVVFCAVHGDAIRIAVRSLEINVIPRIYGIERAIISFITYVDIGKMVKLFK